MYQSDPTSIDPSWKTFFQGYEFARNQNVSEEIQDTSHLDKEFKVLGLIDNYRRRGHLFTLTNPVHTRRKYTPTLDIENFGLSHDDMNTIFQAGKELGIGPASLEEIIAFLKETYCKTIGSEFMYMRIYEKINWLQQKIESSKNSTIFKPDEKKKIFSLLNQAVGFEQFIHRKFVGQKRFSLKVQKH